MSSSLSANLQMYSSQSQLPQSIGMQIIIPALEQQTQYNPMPTLPSFSSILHPPPGSHGVYQARFPAALPPILNSTPPLQQSPFSQSVQSQPQPQHSHYSTLHDFLSQLSLPQYEAALANEGFENVATLYDATEEDFIAAYAPHLHLCCQ